ncbi:autotransporter outer membrane beta-barrel domain-containing protein [Rhodophyticola sp. CCM32]|uniref:Ig-like domain-containing protein n=1 Tax=Rhodophyticola sp. CCM32 TaxID=2916397 RepID=UPI00107FC191|nr:Ig-like domain-containing protein [Rhodophyticola sp. CCM32]QBY00042.1 autotransporter outer membrane beta-barrel domain-containing protein [Rhodophyticola sp. CCM32]
MTPRAARHTVSLPAGAAIDAAGHASLAASVFAVQPDGTPPQLQISGLPDSLAVGEMAGLTFTFSEPVTGFAADDIVLGNASLSQFSGGPQTYQAGVTADADGPLTVSVAQGAAQDASGEGSAAASVSTQAVTVPDTGEEVADFLTTRSRDLVANQPRLSGFLSGQQSGRLSASVSRGQGRFEMQTDGRGPVWMSLQAARSEDDTGQSGSYARAVLGGHTVLSETMLLGAMIQLDHSEMTNAQGTEVEGHGWLAGPYVVAQFPGHPLYIEGRLLYGQTSNTVTAPGSPAAQFDGDRWLAMLTLSGAVHSAGLSTYPSLSFSHVSDGQDAYRNAAGVLVPAQTVGLSELAIGLDFEKPFVLAAGDLMINWGVSGIWSRMDGGGSAFIDRESSARGRFDLGYRFDNHRGLTASANMFLDGIGSADGHISYGIEAGLRLEF